MMNERVDEGRLTVADIDVRFDLRDAQTSFVTTLGEPGTWWVGSERIAIADEVRTALGESERQPWEAPSAIDGLIPETHELPPWAIDVVWRVTNHPGTTTHEWYEAIIERAMHDGAARVEAERRYVELVGIVAVTNAVDRFADAMGLRRLPLPTPEPGAASGSGPDVDVDAHWVPTVEAAGPNVLKALSAVPAAQESIRPISSTHYVPHDAVVGDLTWRRDALSRPQIELVAAATSMANECFY